MIPRRLPPHRFPLGGRVWRVRYGFPPDKGVNARKHWGFCDRPKAVIHLNPELRLKKNHDLLWTTFAHEVLHAVRYCLSHHVIDRTEDDLGEFLEWAFRREPAMK